MQKLKKIFKKSYHTHVFLIYELCQHTTSIFLHILLVFHNCVKFFFILAFNKSYRNTFLLFSNVGDKFVT